MLAPQALLWQAPQLALYQLLAQAAESHRPELSENRRPRALHPTRASCAACGRAGPLLPCDGDSPLPGRSAAAGPERLRL